jgi:hypothetical protein
MTEPTAGHELDRGARVAEHDLERAETYLHELVLVDERAWPPHYQEAAHRLDAVLDKYIGHDGPAEVLDAVLELVGAAESVQLRIGFHLGRYFAAQGELSHLNICRAVETAGGNVGRVFVEVVERELLGIVPQ